VRSLIKWTKIVIFDILGSFCGEFYKKRLAYYEKSVFLHWETSDTVPFEPASLSAFVAGCEVLLEADSLFCNSEADQMFSFPLRFDPKLLKCGIPSF
jgi:hypothetical protein